MDSYFIKTNLKNLRRDELIKCNNKIRMNYNENYMDIPEDIKKLVSEYILKSCSFNRYPDDECLELKEELSRYVGVDIKNILVGNGADQIIQFVMNAFICPRDKVLCPFPSYEIFEVMTQLYEGIVTRYNLYDGEMFNYNKSEIIKIYKMSQPKIIMICSPNNPTGNIINREFLTEILEVCNQSLIVVDEAYGEFCDVGFASLVKNYNHLLVIKTLSKAYSLAGIRCGYLIGSEEIISQVRKVVPDFNVSAFTQFISLTALKNRSIFMERLKHIAEEREYLFNNLLKIKSIAVFPSNTNFLLIQSITSDNIFEELLENGILIKCYVHEELRDFYRVTVGDRMQNDLLIRVFRKLDGDK